MPQPANASAIFRVLTDISSPACPPLVTRSDQQTYLKNLTSTHKFTYYSSTYGHTIHDATSLRKVLANTMRHHPNPAFGTAGGNAAVDMLFEHGCEMLEPGYVEEVTRAAAEEIVEENEREEEEEEEEEESEGGEVVLEVEENEDDEDFVPSSRRRLRRRETPPGSRKRKASDSDSDASAASSEDGWRESEPKQIKQRRGAQSGMSPFGAGRRETKSLKRRRRSNVGGIDVGKRSQLDMQYSRDGTEAVVDDLPDYRSPLVLAGGSQARQPERSDHGGGYETQAGGGPSNDVKLREAVERLNRRVHTAIVQLWDEVGGIL